MDELRKKLMGLVCVSLQGGCVHRCNHSYCPIVEITADRLIANGVTVADGKDTDVPAEISPQGQSGEPMTNCQQWVPVAERVPEICGYPVLMAAVDKYGQKKIVKGFTNYELPVEFCTNEKEYDLCWHCWEVTHWMPLPELPKGE